MMKQIAFYCSGKATRLIKFLSRSENKQFVPACIVYDGGSEEIYIKLNELTGSKTEIDFVFYDGDMSKLEKSKHISQILNRALTKKNINWLFCFGDKILVGDIINRHIINFHPSLLPSFPGLNAIDKAIEKNVLYFGNTAHLINEGTDTGPIIMQSILSRAEFKNYDSVLDMQLNMLKQIWLWIEADQLIIHDQTISINGAKYIFSDYLPNLEFDITD